MGILISALAFFLLISVLVLIHEFGHYLAAKEAGVIVEEFGFGLPPRAMTLFIRKKTRFSLNWIPFGGFVRLKGENVHEESKRREKGSFSAAPISSRIVILTAGVAMNFLFAFVLFTVGFSLGKWIPTYITFNQLIAGAQRGDVSMTPGILIEKVVAGGSAESVHLPTPSVLLSINGQVVTKPEEVLPLQLGKQLAVYALLIGEDFSKRVDVTVPVVDGRTGVELHAYARNLTAPIRSPLLAAKLSFREAGVLLEQTIYGLGRLVRSVFSSGKVPEDITGIVGIAEFTHRSVEIGFMAYLRLVATLSLSIGILNILPIPALDGGRLFFVLYEALFRKPANRRFELTTNLVGFCVIIFLILIVTYHDIIRLF